MSILLPVNVCVSVARLFSRPAPTPQSPRPAPAAPPAGTNLAVVSLWAAAAAGATWGGLGTFSSSVCLLRPLSPSWETKLPTWVLWVSVRRCSWPPWSLSARLGRTRPGESRSGSFLTPKRPANRRANTEGSASATTHVSAPRATKERPASMVKLQTFLYV